MGAGWMSFIKVNIKTQKKKKNTCKKVVVQGNNLAVLITNALNSVLFLTSTLDPLSLWWKSFSDNVAGVEMCVGDSMAVDTILVTGKNYTTMT